MEDTLALLARSLEQVAAILAAVPVEEAGRPTPCAYWDVGGLVRHVVGQDLPQFAVAARGEDADWQSPPQELGPDWSAQFRGGADRLLEQWHAADPEQLVAMPGGREAPLRGRVDQQIAELTVHGWDLAQAVDAQVTLDPALAEHALAWSRPLLQPQFRGPDSAFGAEVAVPADAPAYDRLAGWFGRDPHWSADPRSAG